MRGHGDILTPMTRSDLYTCHLHLLWESPWLSMEEGIYLISTLIRKWQRKGELLVSPLCVWMALLIGVLVFPNLFKEGTGSVNTLHSFDSRKKQKLHCNCRDWLLWWYLAEPWTVSRKESSCSLGRAMWLWLSLHFSQFFIVANIHT